MPYKEHDNRISDLEKTAYGNGELGDHQKVTIMWRIHVWLLCAGSAGLGTVFTIIIQRYMK